jgi:hypothetical protein
LALFGTRRLEALKLVQRAEVRALDAGFVTGQDGEGVGAAGVAQEDIGHAVLGRDALVLLLDVFGVIEQAEIECASFHTANAGEAPGGHDHLFDQEGFDGTDGLLGVLVGLEQFLELVLVLADDDGVLGSEPMFEGIEANGGLAFGGLGAGGFEGVRAVGVNLFLGSHVGAPWEISAAGVALSGWRMARERRGAVGRK